MFKVLRFLSAGESHGPALTAILDGLPAGLQLDEQRIAAQLMRRQGGYGRGGRMKIEHDEVEFLGGVRFGRTTGAPVSLLLRNRDHENWGQALAAFGAAEAGEERRLSRPRPGHADLTGMLKYGHQDARDILERASARETAVRVAAGEVARALLAAVGGAVFSHVIQVGAAQASLEGLDDATVESRAADSPLHCADNEAAMIAEVDAARADGDTVGGVFEVVVTGLPVGLGSCMAPDRRLDARLAMAVLSVPAVKGCEFGPAFANAGLRGSQVHDEIQAGGQRVANRAGGLEGGMSTGQALRVRGAMKPISTLRRALGSIDMDTGKAAPAGFERSDSCALPAAGVVAEAAVSLVLADALLESFGADRMDAIVDRVRRHADEVARRLDA
ncbi:chorismate synthase [bacterium]|nr:MAG: chorismate synthase [bacterium]